SLKSLGALLTASRQQSRSTQGGSVNILPAYCQEGFRGDRVIEQPTMPTGGNPSFAARRFSANDGRDLPPICLFQARTAPQGIRRPASDRPERSGNRCVVRTTSPRARSADKTTVTADGFCGGSRRPSHPGSETAPFADRE